MSDEIELPSLDSFGSRKAFNEWKEKASSFNNKNNLRYQFKKNDYGVVATVSELNKLARDTKKVQKMVDQKLKEIEKKPLFVGGKKEGTIGQKLATMKNANPLGLYRPPNFNFNDISHPDVLKEKIDKMSKRVTGEYYDKRLNKMRETYLRELELSFNSDADYLIELLKQMPLEDFYEMYMMEQEFDFQLFYKMKYLDSQGHEDIIRNLESHVERYYRDDVNPLFRLRNK